MATSRKTKSPSEVSEGKSYHTRSFSYQTTTFLGLVISSLTFLSAAFLYLHLSLSAGTAPIVLPKSFAVCSVLVMVSGFLVTLLIRYYKTDQSRSLLYTHLALTGISMVIATLVANGTASLLPDTIFTPESWGKQDALVLLCGVFLLHITAGILYLLRLGSLIINGTADMVQSLLYFTDDLQLTRIRMISIYWYFTNSAWLFVYFLLLFTN